jgi:hypothetical protein
MATTPRRIPIITERRTTDLIGPLIIMGLPRITMASGGAHGMAVAGACAGGGNRLETEKAVWARYPDGFFVYKAVPNHSVAAKKWHRRLRRHVRIRL